MSQVWLTEITADRRAMFANLLPSTPPEPEAFTKLKAKLQENLHQVIEVRGLPTRGYFIPVRAGLGFDFSKGR